MMTDRRRATQILLPVNGFSLRELVTFIVVGRDHPATSIDAFVGVMSNFSTPDYQVMRAVLLSAENGEITSNAYGDILVTSGDLLARRPRRFQRKWNICYVTASNPDNVSQAPTPVIRK
jgi:hypothetical protein